MAVIEKELIRETVEQVPGHRIRLNMPVFVDPRIPIREFHAAVGIEEWISSRVFTDANPPPEVPYIYRLHSLHLGLSAEEARDRFEAGEVGITLFEASALYLYYPDFIRNCAVGTEETSLEFNKIKYHPRISKHGSNGAKIDFVEANYKSPRYGILTRSQKIYLPASVRP